MPTGLKTFFAPQLIITDCAAAIKFYEEAFGVQELQRWSNDDGSVHVAELSFDGALFHIHEPTAKQQISPQNGVTCIIGVFVDDVHAVTEKAVAAGATILNPVEDYDYGYRQATITDPLAINGLLRGRYKKRIFM